MVDAVLAAVEPQPAGAKVIADAASDRPAHRRPGSSVPVDGFLDILLVEDDPEDVRLLFDLMPSRTDSELELRFTVAPTLEDASTAMASTAFDAIALDLSLPDAQGLTGLYALKRVAPQIPVVVVTGAQNHQLAQLAIAAGAQDYLVKGVDAANAFTRSIRYAIERQQLFRERDDVAALLRQRAEQLMRANARLTAAADARDELVAVVSHELRTPLTPISGFTETLQHRLAGRINDDETEMLAAIARNATRLRAHVEQLLSVSELTLAGQLPADRTTVGIAELLQRVADDQLDASDDLLVEADPALTIHANELHVDQIVTNLLVNARKYGRPPVRLVAHADGRHTVVTVTDHGDGVPSEFVPQLFDRFSQASTGTRRTASGVGLGLHVARRLALLHGGDLTYEPSAGAAGARFVLRLPATAASVSSTGDAEHAGRSTPRRCTWGWSSRPRHGACSTPPMSAWSPGSWRKRSRSSMARSCRRTSLDRMRSRWTCRWVWTAPVWSFRLTPGRVHASNGCSPGSWTMPVARSPRSGTSGTDRLIPRQHRDGDDRLGPGRRPAVRGCGHCRGRSGGSTGRAAHRGPRRSDRGHRAPARPGADPHR